MLTDAWFSWGIRAIGNGFSRMIVSDLTKLEPHVIKHLRQLDAVPLSRGLSNVTPEPKPGQQRSADQA